MNISLIIDALNIIGAIIIFLLILIMLIYISIVSGIFNYYKVKCPYCKHKQEDSSYSKQVCEKCKKEWREEIDF